MNKHSHPKEPQNHCFFSCKNYSFRTLIGIALLFGILILAGAYALQYFLKLEPCSLCILQRFALYGVLIILILALIHNPSRVGRAIYTAVGFILSLAGAGLAMRQIYIQHLPPSQVPECTAGLDKLLHALPFFEAIKTVLTTAGECSKIEWSFLGFSLAAWSLVAFFVLFVYLLYVFILFAFKKS